MSYKFTNDSNSITTASCEITDCPHSGGNFLSKTLYANIRLTGAFPVESKTQDLNEKKNKTKML
jgi:hypothetical protein